MFVFVVWQINCPSLWVRSLISLRSLTMRAKIRRLEYVQSPQSEVWKLISNVRNPKSDVRSLTKSEVWCPTSVPKLSELCPKSEVLRISVQNLESETKVWSPKSESKTSLKSETEVQSLTPKIRSLKLKVWNLKSKVCLKSVQSLNSEICRGPKYYVQSLSEVWLLKAEFWSLKLPPKFKMAE